MIGIRTHCGPVNPSACGSFPRTNSTRNRKTPAASRYSRSPSPGTVTRSRYRTMTSRRDDVEGDLVQHRWVHRQVAAGAAGEGRGRLGRHRHPPREVGRGAERQLGQEASDATDGSRHGDRQEISVAGRARVAGRALGQGRRHVPASERSDEALAAVLDGDRQGHAIHRRVVLEMLPSRDQPRADQRARDGGDGDRDDRLVEPAPATEVAVVEGQSDGQGEDGEGVMGQDAPGTELDQDRVHRTDPSECVSRGGRRRDVEGVPDRQRCIDSHVVGCDDPSRHPRYAVVANPHRPARDRRGALRRPAGAWRPP